MKPSLIALGALGFLAVGLTTADAQRRFDIYACADAVCRGELDFTSRRNLVCDYTPKRPFINGAWCACKKITIWHGLTGYSDGAVFCTRYHRIGG